MTPQGRPLAAVCDEPDREDRWRSELERQVTSRTLELELRNSLLRVLSVIGEDEKALLAALESILEKTSSKAMILVYYDGRRMLKAAIANGAGLTMKQLDAADISLLERAAKGEVSGLSLLGEGVSGMAAYSIEDSGDHCGYVVLGRADRGFGPDELSVLATAFKSFGVNARLRKQKAREEWVRQETEQALRRSEEKLRTFFEESKDMIYSTNADDVVASINNAGLALLGFSDRFEIIGRPFADHILSVEDRHLFLSRLREQGFVMDYECVFVRKDGSTVFCIETAHAVRDKNGRIVEVQGIVKDISERIANERQLWQANLELADANEKLKSTHMLMIQHEKLASIGQLAAGIAHEINNPLGFLSSNQTTITGFLRVLRQAWTEAAALDPERHGEIAARLDLEYILEEIEALISESDEGFRRIIDIVQNLKSFARADSAPVMGPFDLNEGIKSTLVVARNELKYVAEIELDFEAMPPIRALGGEINQVVLNILVNAAQAIESQKRKEKGKILIATRLEGDWAVLSISDDGPGIPEESRLKVFDPFFTTKEPGKGTGLGLSITYDIVTRKHGGSISISDSPWGGACFTITLPVEGLQAAAADPEPDPDPG